MSRMIKMLKFLKNNKTPIGLDLGHGSIKMIQMVDNDGELLLGLRGRAKVRTDPMPLGTRLWRFINHTFSFKM